MAHMRSPDAAPPVMTACFPASLIIPAPDKSDRPAFVVGTWPCVWHHLVDTPASRTFVAAFTKKYGKPPENQAWGDYIATKIVAQTVNEIKSADSTKIVEHLEKGAKFDLLKTRPGYFRASDHQLMHEMYAITALPENQIKNQWDIFTSSPAVPGPNEELEVIASTKEENSCTFPT